MSYTLRGRLESRLAALLPVVVAACVLALAEHRWWSATEIQAAAGETFAPRRLGVLLEQLLREGPPSAPIDVGL